LIGLELCPGEIGNANLEALTKNKMEFLLDWNLDHCKDV